jgi:hypothetical protein
MTTPWGSAPWGSSPWGEDDLATLLQIVDPNDVSSVLFDLNDQVGANSALYGNVSTFLHDDLDLGVPTLRDATGTAVFNRDARAALKFRMRIKGTSPDNLATAVGRLGDYLAKGCVLKWITNNGTQTRYIDVEPSDTPVLYAGRDLNIWEATVLFDTPQGVTLNLSRLPYLRGDALTASTNKLVNPTLLRDSNADGTPESWTKTGTTTLTIAAASESLHSVASAASSGVWQATGSATASSGQIWTLSADVKVTSGTFVLDLEFRNAADAFLSDLLTTQTATGWKRISGTATAPANTDHIRAWLMSSGGACTFDVRNVQLEIASTASPFRVTAQTLNIDPATAGFSKMMPIYNPGTTEAPCVITTAFPDASTSVEALDYFLATTDNIPGNHRLADYLNGPYFAQAEANGNGWTLTAGVDTTLAGVADATASPGSGTSAARITHSTDPTTYNKRITFTRTTLLDSLRGTHRVFVRVKPASTSKFRLQLNWSAGTATSESNDEFVLDQTNDSVPVWALCDLGTIEVPDSIAITLGSLTLELSTRMGLGLAAVNLDVDYLMLVPQADVASVLFADAETSVTSITDGADGQVPKDLGAGDPTWVTGSVHGHRMKLNAVNEAVGVGSTTTGGFIGVSGGRHQVRFAFDENNFIGTYQFEIANITDNTVARTAQSVTTLASNESGEIGLILDDVAGKLYQPRVTITAYTSGSVEIRSFTVIPIIRIVQNQQVRADPGSTGLERYAAERLDSSGFYVGALDAERVPFWIPPGLSLLWVESYDLTVGGVELPHFNARTLTVTPTVYPRFWS